MSFQNILPDLTLSDLGGKNQGHSDLGDVYRKN